MKPAEYIKELSNAGITANSDGLLRDFINRGQWSAALKCIPDSIEKREHEIAYLKALQLNLNLET